MDQTCFASKLFQWTMDTRCILVKLVRPPRAVASHPTVQLWQSPSSTDSQVSNLRFLGSQHLHLAGHHSTSPSGPRIAHTEPSWKLSAETIGRDGRFSSQLSHNFRQLLVDSWPNNSTSKWKPETHNQQPTVDSQQSTANGQHNNQQEPARTRGGD